MDEDNLQRVLRDQLPTLAAPTMPPPNARTRVRQAVARRRHRQRAAVGSSVAGAFALVILVPLAVTGGSGTGGSDDPVAPADTAVGSWEPTAESPLSARNGSVSVWTGEEMIVVGGNVRKPCPPTADCTGPSREQLRSDGAAYDPDTDTWRSIASAPIPFTWGEVGWTGREMVVLTDRHTLAYDPESDGWHELDAPPRGYLIGGVWNGQELYFWQSGERSGTADWSLDPSTGQWTKLPPDPFGSTFDRAYVWTGDRFVFVGLPSNNDERKTFLVAEYDPTSRTWRELPESPVGFGGVDWFFHEGYVVNPHEDPLRDEGRLTGGAYDPETETWSQTPKSGRYMYGGCLLGALGSAGDWLAPGGGVLYSLDPADTVVAPDCPQLQEPAAAAWTGEQIVIWGGPDRKYEANTALGLAWTPPPAG